MNDQINNPLTLEKILKAKKILEESGPVYPLYLYNFQDGNTYRFDTEDSEGVLANE